MENKICSRCKKEKNCEDFYKDKRAKSGFYSACKECLKIYNVYFREYSRLHRRNDENYYKKWFNNNKEKMNIWFKNYYKNPHNKELRKIRLKTNYLIKSGKILKANQCSRCSSDKNIEAHHLDYNNFQRIIWLCRKCHKELHRK